MKGLGLRGLSRSIGATLGRQVFAAMLNLLTVVLIARVYGPEGNGAFAMALLLPSMLASFLNLGVAPANVYFLGSNQVTVRDLVRANAYIFMWLGTLGSMFGAGLLIWNASGVFPGISPLILWFALAVFPISLLNSYLQSVFQGLQQFKPYNLLTILQPFMLLLLVSGLTLLDNRELAFLVGAQFISQMAVLGLTLLWLKPVLGPKVEALSTTDIAKKTLGYGWKAHLSNILAFVNYKADVFLVNFFVGPAAVGVYVIAVAISEKLWLLSQAVSTVLLPRLSQLSADEYKRKMLTPLITRWVLLITLIAALILAAVAQWLIVWIFGSDYSGAVLPLWILLPGIVCSAASRVIANDIAARGRPEWNMYTSLIVVSVNVICNILLIPEYGLVGAATATTIANSIKLVMRLWVYGRFSGNHWMDSIFIRVEDVRLAKEMVRAA
jgi:O-antigen/teichoic acid export membrane protein